MNSREGKLYSEGEAAEEAHKIKDLVGKSGSKEDYETAEHMVEEELTLTPEAQRIIDVYQEARNARELKKQRQKSLEFVRLLSALVEPNENDPTAALRWHDSDGERARKIVFFYDGQDDQILTLGSGSSGRRIFFWPRHPNTYEHGHFMQYPKPSDMDWEYSSEYWKAFMQHFKREIVDLERMDSKDA